MRTLKIFQCIAIFMLVTLFITSCGILEPQKLNGSLIIILEQKEKDISRELARVLDNLNSVQCILKKGSETIYNNNLTKIDTYYEGEFKDLDPGNDYSVLLYGKSVSSEIIQRGSRIGISIKAGEKTTATLTWSEFIPSLTSPSNDSTVNDNTPTFDWAAVSGASVYELEVDNSSSFDSPEIHQNSLTSTEYTPGSSLSDGTYYWHVRCQDSEGNWGGWSDTWNITIEPVGPSAPTLLSPSNGSITNDNTPTFDWSDVSGASVYELEVDNSSSFNSPEIDQNSLSSSDYTATSSLTEDVYFWRVRCKDSQGNWGGWSEEWSFTIIAFVTGTVTDVDGNVYQTVKIGDQWWMAENLKVTHYRNGDAIPNVTDDTEWSNLTSGAYCVYDNNESNLDTYGYLYNWYAIDDSRNIAPEGWHVPSDAEWETIIDYLGGSDVAGGKLKETGSEHWLSPNTGATNESGFTTLPSGYRIYDSGCFDSLGGYAYFWSSTEYSSWGAWFRTLGYNHSAVYRSYGSKIQGFAIRVVMDTETPVTLDSISISPSTATLFNSKSQQFTCKAYYSDGTNQNVTSSATWSNSPGTAGSIDSNGLFTASSSTTGTETVTASYGGQVTTASVTVSATVTLSSVEVSPSSVGLSNGSTQQFTCTAIYSDESTQDVTSSATWSTSPGTAGTIDSNGRFTASSSITGTETVTASFDGQEATASVYVIETGTVTDIDGNVYQTVKIGDQWWMAENLKVKHYRNGDAIPNVTDNTEWSNLTTCAYCAYNNDEGNADTYGYLYNWYAVNYSQNIAPEGWHVPADAEWQTLVDYLGGSAVAGGIIKETETDHWQDPNAGATNERGFSGLPGGLRNIDGTFMRIGEKAQFWSSTEMSKYFARSWGASWIDTGLPGTYDYKHYGFSIRCVKGELARVDSIAISPSTVTLSNGETQKFTCTAYYSDGSNQDVSSSATWSTDPGTAGSINSDGLFTASSSTTGTEMVTVSFYGQEATASVYVIETGALTDIDGNFYLTVKIGDQWWMAENLKVTHYRNGDVIPNVTDNTEWSSLSTGAYCAYENIESNADTYGYLYNWYAVDDSRNIAPEGWHVPSDEEWQTLVDYLGGSSVAGGKLKEAGNDHWASPNTGATNESGFSALAGGYRNFYNGGFEALRDGALFWSSTGSSSNNAWIWTMSCSNSEVHRDNGGKNYGFAIRLVKDTGIPVTLDSIRVTPSTASLYNSETQQFSCTAYYSDGSNQNVTSSATWSTSPGTAGSVDSNGLFTASSSATGTETVTASYSGQQASASVYVIETGTLTDIDGNIYQTVKIGDQWWMAENLKVTHYRNGDVIPHVTDKTEWSNLTAGAYCAYNNDEGIADTYGYLYNWHVVNDSRNIAPEGWHVPTDAEWQTLVDYLGGSSVAGGKLKESGTNHWYSPNTDATNESGFTALPGGMLDYTDDDFFNLGISGHFWSTYDDDEYARYRTLWYDSSEVFRYLSNKKYVFSIRLVRD